MTNNSAPETKRFQFSLRELFGMVLLTACVTALVDFVTSNRPSNDRIVLLICTSVGTLAISLIILWLFETHKTLLFLLVLVTHIAVVTILLIEIPPRMLRSHITPNHIAAAAMCKACAEAQEIYHRTDWDGDGVLEYAQTIQDLIDKKPGDGLVGMLDRATANADAGLPIPVPKHGYFVKVLSARDLNGKWKSYIVENNMTQGFAIIAYPQNYKAGEVSYMISDTGTIYKKDLGINTAKIAFPTTVFDVSPGTDWVPLKW